jgi:hypothetical protein
MRSLCLVALLVAGCGGGAEQGGDAATDSSRDGGSDARDTGVDSDSEAGDAAAWSPVCPRELPSLGSACSDENVECEYGELQYDIGCDTVVECNCGTWVMADYGPTGCQPDGPNPSGCPSTYAGLEADLDDECSMGLQCEYTQAVCQCLSVSSGGPVFDDAGAWQCEPGAGCPLPRPRLGSTCSTPGESCTYTPCAFGEECKDGYWQANVLACAGG